MQRRNQMILRARGDRWLQGNIFQPQKDSHLYSETRQRTWNLHRFQTDGVPALRGGSRHSIPPLTKKLPVTDATAKRKPLFSSGVSLIYQPHFREGPTPGKSWTTKNKLSRMLRTFCSILFCSACFVMMDFGVIFPFVGFFCVPWFSFVLIWERRKEEHKVGWIGKWGGTQRGNDENILHESFFN